MYIFFFWPFRVIGFILTLYALSAIVENFFPNLILGDALASIVSTFVLVLVALFWINFVDLYLKLMSPDEVKSKRGKRKKGKRQSVNFISALLEVFTGLLRAIINLINFLIGLLNPLVWIFIIITILASIAT